MCLRKTYAFLLFCLLSLSASAGNPAIHGTWKGYLLFNGLDADNSDGLPVTLNIVDDNDNGDYQGEMFVQYRYQTDIYKAKYAVQGNIDYEKYLITLQQTKLLYYDLLPKALQWCFGEGTLNIYRSTYAKKIYMDGYMGSNCGEQKMRLILVKM